MAQLHRASVLYKMILKHPPWVNLEGTKEKNSQTILNGEKAKFSMTCIPEYKLIQKKKKKRRRNSHEQDISKQSEKLGMEICSSRLRGVCTVLPKLHPNQN